MDYEEIEQEVNSFANFLRYSNIYFLPTDGDMLSKEVIDNSGNSWYIYSKDKRKIYGNVTKYLKNSISDVAILTNKLLDKSSSTESFKELIYENTIQSYFCSTELKEVLDVFTCSDYILFDEKRVENLEKVYLRKKLDSFILKYREESLDLFKGSQDMKNIKFIQEWIDEYLIKYGNNQEIISMEVQLETIIDNSESIPF
ncbi:hypothetical protein CL617_02275 [archaeon]|nr:hypothetical protein [archaeon]|tara:strand:- start:706 stop:1305 length:600 start_codon:yes stop_codon:yes gene_type:complete